MLLSTYGKEGKLLLAVDCIILGFDKEEHKILIIRHDFKPEKGK